MIHYTLPPLKTHKGTTTTFRCSRGGHCEEIRVYSQSSFLAHDHQLSLRALPKMCHISTYLWVRPGSAGCYQNPVVKSQSRRRPLCKRVIGSTLIGFVCFVSLSQLACVAVWDWRISCLFLRCKIISLKEAPALSHLKLIFIIIDLNIALISRGYLRWLTAAV